MMCVYFKAVGLNHVSTHTARLALESELLDMGIFDLADSIAKFDSHYIVVSVPNRFFSRLVVKVTNSRLFLCSCIGRDLLFTYSIS